MELIFIDYDLKLLRLGYIPDKISNTPGKRLHYTVPNSNFLTMTMIKYKYQGLKIRKHFLKSQFKFI